VNHFIAVRPRPLPMTGTDIDATADIARTALDLAEEVR
jgi:hypothetical protein